MSITIYHNPACSKSRNTLALIRRSGAEPRVIAYLETPPTRVELKTLMAAAALTPRQLLRQKEALFAELGLGDPTLSDDVLIDAMLAHPILIDRPLVVSPKGTRLCRPPELVLEILPDPGIGTFTKEDSEEAQGKR